MLCIVTIKVEKKVVGKLMRMEQNGPGNVINSETNTIQRVKI